MLLPRTETLDSSHDPDGTTEHLKIGGGWGERVKVGTAVLWTTEVGRAGVAQGHLVFDLKAYSSEMFGLGCGQPSPWEKEPPLLSVCNNSHSYPLRKDAPLG